MSLVFEYDILMEGFYERETGEISEDLVTIEDELSTRKELEFVQEMLKILDEKKIELKIRFNCPDVEILLKKNKEIIDDSNGQDEKIIPSEKDIWKIEIILGKQFDLRPDSTSLEKQITDTFKDTLYSVEGSYENEEGIKTNYEIKYQAYGLSHYKEVSRDED